MDVEALEGKLLRAVFADRTVLTGSAAAHLAAYLWPFIEAHTRAAVEAERAACAEIARAQSWSHTHLGMGGPELNSEAIRAAIAARKAQP